jgi:uncharacterized protein (DUF885 family)
MTETEQPTNPAFQALADEIVDSLFAFQPNLAQWMGLHEFDGQITEYRAESIARRVGQLHDQLDRLGAIDPAGLGADAAHDHALLAFGIESELWDWEQLRAHERHPLTYLGAVDVGNYIKRNYAPLEQRLAALTRQLQALPEAMAAAEANMAGPVPAPWLETAEQLFGGMAAYLGDELDRDIRAAAADVNPASLDDPTDLAPAAAVPWPADYATARDTAREAVARFLAFVQGKRAGAPEAFAIGRPLYEQMLWAKERIDLPLERVLDEGWANLRANQAAMVEACRRIDPTKSVPEVIQLIGAEHPPSDELVPVTRAMLEEIRAYLIDQRIVSVPSEVRCRVEPTPVYLRWASAMMDSPGPFETTATEAFYYVTPTEPEWTLEEQEGWLTQFNIHTLRAVSIHEAYPGHYVHFLHNKRITSRPQMTYYSTAFTEGWAHYTEQMMLEEGYGGGDPKLWAAQLSEALLRNCRYIVSILMHTQGMSLPEAAQFIQDNAYYEALPAYREALRGTWNPEYLNYTLGKLALLKLRADYQAQCAATGTPFDLCAFHDAVLAYGGPPVPLLRRRLLTDAAQHAALL